MVHSANNKPLEPLSDFIDLPQAKHYFVAYSGGKDSTALLHALTHNNKTKHRLTAIHINHNINADSAQWANHCQRVCQQFNVKLISESVKPSDNSENACRMIRQMVFKQHLSKGDCLLTAHHLNDHIETVLFRLFRGTGLQGMTGMAQTNTFDHYTIHRPLVSLSQSVIQDYVTTNRLPHIEDPSNSNNHYSRNHIRNLIMPELQNYDPMVLSNMASTVNNIKQSQNLLQQMIGHTNPFDYKKYIDPKLLSTAMYHWLHNLNLMAPNQKRLRQFSVDCLQASADKNPRLEIDSYRLVRWHNRIYALHLNNHFAMDDFDVEFNDSTAEIELPNNGKLLFNSEQKVSIPAVIKYQQRHELIQLKPNDQHRKLKKLFQQHKIPPWERDGLPYLYIENRLMAVGDKIISYQFKQILSQYNAEYRWLSPSFVL